MKQFRISYIKFYLLTLLYAIAIVLLGFAKADAQQPQYFGLPNQLAIWKGGLKADKYFGMPVGDTVTVQLPGADSCGQLKLKIRPGIDTILYYHNCKKWLAVGSGFGSGNFPGWDTLNYYYDELTLIAYVNNKINTLAVLLNDSVGGSGTNPWEWISKHYADLTYMPKNRTITINGVTQNVNDNPVFTITGSGTCECEVTLDYLDSLFNTISTNAYYAGYAIIFNGDTISVDTSLIPTYHSLDTLRESIIDWVIEQGYSTNFTAGWATYVNGDTVGCDSVILDDRYVNSVEIVGDNMVVDGVEYPIPCVCDPGVIDTDPDPTNEIQHLYIVGNLLGLSQDDTFTVPWLIAETDPHSPHKVDSNQYNGYITRTYAENNFASITGLNAKVNKADSNINGGYLSYYYAVNNFATITAMNGKVNKSDSNVNGGYLSYHYAVNNFASITALNGKVNKADSNINGGYLSYYYALQTYATIAGLNLKLNKADSNVNGGYLSYYNAVQNFQPLLGYTPENAANKVSVITPSTTEYPNSTAVINYIAGLNFQGALGAGYAIYGIGGGIVGVDTSVLDTVYLKLPVGTATNGYVPKLVGGALTWQPDLTGGAGSTAWADLTGVPQNIADLEAISFAEGDFLQYSGGALVKKSIAQVKTALAYTTTEVTEGTNLYFTTARFNTEFAGKTTDDLTEGTKKFFSNTLARSAVSASGDISYNSATGVFSYTTPAPADGSETIVTEGTDIDITGDGTPGNPYVINYSGSGGGAPAWTSITGVPTNISELAALSFSANDIPQYVGGVLTKRTPAQVKASMSLDNVPNVDATNANNLASGTIPAARIGAATVDVGDINATGTPSASTVLYGNGTWASPGGGTVTNRTYRYVSSVINWKTTGATLIFTTEASLGRFIITRVYFTSTALNGNSGNVVFRIGWTGANYFDFINNESINATSFFSVGDTYYSSVPSLGSVKSSAPANTGVYVNITTGAGGTTMSGYVVVEGFYQSN